MSTTRTIRAAGAALFAAAALTACSDSSTSPSQARRAVTLSVATTGSSTVGSGTGLGVGGVITVGGGELVITRAQLVLREIELEGPAVTASGCTDDSGNDSNDDSRSSLSVARFSGSDDSGEDDSSHDEGDCGELELGPVLLDLPMGAGVTQEIAVQVPEGTYHEIKFKLRTPDDDAAGRAFVAANPGFANISVRVEGTYNGEPFTFTSPVRAEQKLEFHPDVTVGAGGTNVTLRVNVASWFTDANGEAIDPATAQPGGQNRSLVESHIASSFGAYEDHDRDGEDDSHEDDHGGDDR